LGELRPKKVQKKPSEFLTALSQNIIEFLFQKNMITWLNRPKKTLELMFGIGKISFQWKIVELVNNQGFSNPDSILEPCRKLGILRYRKSQTCFGPNYKRPGIGLSWAGVWSRGTMPQSPLGFSSLFQKKSPLFLFQAV